MARLAGNGKALFGIVAGASLMAIAAPAQASIIEYDVTDYNSGSSCSHGLWTNTRNSGCSRYFSFQDGSTFSIDTDTGTGTFTGTAINDLGETATLDLSLSGFSDTLPGGGTYKAGGLSYDPDRIDFFTNATGSIDIDGATYSLQAGDPFAGSTSFQFGTGANDKTSAFGGSAWLNILDPSGALMPHWDINFNLALRPGTPVPAPGMLVLLALAVGLVMGRNRKSKVVAA